MPIGFRILKRKRAIAPELIERFRILPATNVSDNMSRMAGPALKKLGCEFHSST